MPRPEVMPAFSTDYPELSAIYEQVKAQGVPNYRGAKVLLRHRVNINVWRSYIDIYNDCSLPDMLAYGFPSGHLGATMPVLGLSNHSSALRNPAHVLKYLEKEMSLDVMVGPMQQAHFDWCRNNPLLTHPKRDSIELRVILDLSFPDEASVNSAILQGTLDGALFKLKLPSPLDLARRIVEEGPGCHLYKIDLSRAYRQLRGDPLDWLSMGVMWEEWFLDLAIPFGLRHGASACQRVSEAAAAVSAEKHGSKTEAYVDDTAGAARPEVSVAHFNGLLGTCSELGLQVAQGKCQAPSYFMLWIGVWFDTIEMSMAIDRERIEEALILCVKFLESNRVTLHQMQKLMGKLYHASKCTVSSRAFLARMLDLLRAASRAQVVKITRDARMDAAWLLAFLQVFNGKTMIKATHAQVVAHIDSCLKEAGSICEGMGYYRLEYPDYLVGMSLPIASLECFNLLVAIRLWIEQWSGLHVLLFCDNMATVAASNSAHAEDSLLQGALREVWWLAAAHDVQLTIRHKPGVDMVVPDMLSRVGISRSHRAMYDEFVNVTDESRLLVPINLLVPPIDI